MQEVSRVHQESSHGWEVTDNTENQEDRLPATETAEGSLKVVGAVGTGLGGRLAFGHWSLVEASTPGQRKISRRKAYTLNTPVGRAIQSQPAVELGHVVIRPWPSQAEAHRCHYSERRVELSFQDSSSSFLIQSPQTLNRCSVDL